jgi:hypothetical protein
VKSLLHERTTGCPSSGSGPPANPAGEIAASPAWSAGNATAPASLPEDLAKFAFKVTSHGAGISFQMWHARPQWLAQHPGVRSR